MVKSHFDEAVFDMANAFIKAAELDRINELPSCNDCGKRNDCEYVPKLGERVRINCPLWEGAKK